MFRSLVLSIGFCRRSASCCLSSRCRNMMESINAAKGSFFNLDFTSSITLFFTSFSMFLSMSSRIASSTFPNACIAISLTIALAVYFNVFFKSAFATTLKPSLACLDKNFGMAFSFFPNSFISILEALKPFEISFPTPSVIRDTPIEIAFCIAHDFQLNCPVAIP